MTAPWIQTRSGIAFDLLAPTADMVRRDDIAHSLARIARYSGHTVETWTVAEHSLLVADLLASWGCPVAVVREGLLHDAPEAYYGDLTSPVKAAWRGPEDDPRSIVPLWERVNHNVNRVVRKALALPSDETPIVKRADLVALAIERRDLMAACERDWCLPEYAPRDWPELVPAVVHWLTPGKRIASDFLERWDALDAQIGGAT